MATSARAFPLAAPFRRALAVIILAAASLAATGHAQAATVTVAPGETLSAIAARHGVSVQRLVALNRLSSPHMIVAGTRLRVTGPAVAPRTSGGGVRTAPAGARHRVRPGETLGVIAARHRISVAALARLNGIGNPNRIVAGRMLRLPAGAPRRAIRSAPGAVSPAPAPAGRAAVGPMIDAAAARHGVDPALARAIAWQESGWNQSAVSSAGAIGVMQLMPVTARWIGSDLLRRPLDPRSASDNIDGGVAFLAWLLRQTGDTRTAVGSYYQGLASVRSRGFYSDTRRYVASVLALRGRV